MTQLSVTTHCHGGAVHLCVAGDVDLAIGTTLGHAITTAVITCTPADGVLVDLAVVTFLDCTGVTALLAGRRLAAARNVSYQVVSVRGIDLRVLQTLDFVALLNGATPTAADWPSGNRGGVRLPEGCGVPDRVAVDRGVSDDTHNTGCGNRV